MRLLKVLVAIVLIFLTQLVEMGMDVSCIVDSLLLQPIERIITDAKDKLIEAVRHRYRSLDVVGLPMRFVDKGSLNKTLSEMSDLGVTNLQNYIKGMNPTLH